MGSRIQMFMNDLGFRSESMPPLIYHKIAYFLKCFDTLVVCSRTLGEDANLTSLLTRIDQLFTRYAEIIELHGAIPADLIHDFCADLKSLEVEMDEWYTTLSNCSHPRSTMLINVVAIIDSVVEDLQNFHSLEFSDIGDDTEGMEEKLQLFRNFIEFVEMLNVDEHKQLDTFVIQVASVAVNAAHVCARLHGLFDGWNAQGWKQVKHGWKQIQPQILALLQRIMPVGVEVSQAYRTALSISKSSEELRYSMDLDPGYYSLVIVMKDFIDFLLWCLWESLEMDCGLSDSLKDQVRPLWGGLKFLREHPDKFDEEEIRRGICDAGMVIFSLHHQDSVISDLFGNFEMIMVEAEERISSDASELEIKVEAEELIPETSSLKSEMDLVSSTAVLGDLNSILDSLMEYRNFDDDKTVRLRLDLVYLTSSLKLLMILKDQQADHLQVQALWSLAKKVADSLKILWDHMVDGNIPDSLSPLVDSISKAISIFREDFSAVYRANRHDQMKEDISGGFITETISALQVDTSQILPARRPEMEQEKVAEVLPQLNFLATEKVVGLEEDIKSILDRLRGGWEQSTIIPIVGMAGLGKTTLALQVYNHPLVIGHFHCRACFSVSQVYNRHKLFLSVLNQIAPNGSSGCLEMSQMTEDDLESMLRRSLKHRRYLVFLDDVWDKRVLETVRDCFPDDGNGSRILLTSRDREVIIYGERPYLPYLLRPRSDVESLEILRTKLFPEDDFPAILHELGMRIAERCRGLPMTIVAVAGLLTTLKPDVWKKVLESLDSNTLSRTQHLINSFELSYRYLPDHLKLCFLSFSLYPENEEVSVKWLYLLWIGEGFIHETEGRKIEDVAAEYLMDLVYKSLVDLTKTTSLGEVKTCRLHGSMHGFCVKKAEEEAFSHVLKGYTDILGVNELCGSQRLCIQSSRKDFKSLRLSRPDIQSLLFLPLKDTWPRVVDDASFILRVFKSLRVLHIRQMDLGEVFPGEMKLLAELRYSAGPHVEAPEKLGPALLRYLAVRGHFVDIPSSIGNLSNLQTLIIDAHLEIALPGTIWDLHKLRHLCIKNGFHFQFDNLDDSSVLFQLESCSVVIAESWDFCDRLMQRFPNVAKLKLKCRLLDTISIPDCMHQLESLHVSTAGVVLHSHQFEFIVAPDLQKLTLKDLELSESGISAIGKLPRLESLRLLHVSFSGGGLHMEQGHFEQLRYFKLSDSNILRWTADEYLCSLTLNYHLLPWLEKLVLQGCPCLEEIPCLEISPRLEGIDLFNCSPLVESLVRGVAEFQRDRGNEITVCIK